MNPLNATLGLFLLLTVAVLFQNCGPSLNAAQKAPDAAVTAANLETKIMDLIGDAYCEADSDCDVVEFGVRPCGGPAEYLVYSTLRTDPSKLEAMVSAYNQANQEVNDRSGLNGTCEALLPPSRLTCATNTCIAEFN